MSHDSTERSNFSKWLWVAALTPMCLCGVVMAVLFGTNLVTLRQTTQQQSLRNTQSRLTSRAFSLTSSVNVKASEQARAQTATAIMQALSNGSRYPLILSEAFDVNSKNWLNGIHTSGHRSQVKGFLTLSR
jgi:xanthine/uracil permease